MQKIKASSIGLDYILTGTAGIPLGEMFEIEGEAVADPGRNLPKEDRSTVLLVRRVNGKELPVPVEVWIADVGAIPPATTFRLRVTEEARYELDFIPNSSPDYAARDPGRQRLFTFVRIVEQLSPEHPRWNEMNEAREAAAGGPISMPK